MNTIYKPSIIETANGTKVLIANTTKQYIGKCVMQTDGKKRLQQIQKQLDRCLTILDDLRTKTELEEKQVFELLREERLLKENLV